MLRRLFLLMLTLCLATPAVAMPLAPVTGHEAMVADCHGQMPDDGKQEKPDPADHGCIGCLAPFRMALVADKRVLSIAPPVLPPLSAQRTDHMSAPEPPPPRA